MLLLATGLRPPAGLGPAPLARLLGLVGADAVLLGEGCSLRLVPEMAVGTSVAALGAPMPDDPLPTGKRLPHLSATDPDERGAAVALGCRALEAAEGLGAALVTVDLGGVPLAVPEPEIRRFYARRELEDGEPGAPALAALLAERRARSPRVLDACHFALDRLAAHAEGRGVVLALVLAPAPWGAPTPREAVHLLEELRGAPLGTVFAPAALARLAALGIETASARRQALAGAARLVDVGDAVGLDGGYLTGLGEVDLAAELGKIDPAIPRVLGGAPWFSDAEVAGAAEAARRCHGA